MRAPADPGPLQDVPPVAAEVFGDRLELALGYARLLATAGVERGLIGPHEAPRLWTRHLLNSAAISAWVPHGVDVVDLGSGAGLPGIPLALARPDLNVTLVEPMARRVTFLTEVIDALGLHIDVRRARGEELPTSSTDAVVARAVAPLVRLVSLTLPVLRPHGRLVALKGTSAEAELASAAGALSAWPQARAGVVRAAAGEKTTTAVMIVLDDGWPDSASSDSGGSPQ